jgi:hypothetical protein
MKSINFWDITPCSPLKVNRRLGGTSDRLACWFLAEFISSTLKMEAICSSEASVDTQRTTRRYIPEVDTLLLHCLGIGVFNCFLSMSGCMYTSGLVYVMVIVDRSWPKPGVVVVLPGVIQSLETNYRLPFTFRP